MAPVMKKLFVVFVVVGIIVFFGCNKNLPDTTPCTALSPFADSAALLKYAHDSSIQVVRDSSGMYYQILDSGNSTRPIISSNITVNYVGRLIVSGAIFDSATNSNLNGARVSGLITGWQIGLPKIGVGGHIIMLIPSVYGYGCTGYGPVPGNAPLYFDVRLLQVN
jgi:FKBP-type peptidyl-prolyl cis-trans isomerase FkpA